MVDVHQICGAAYSVKVDGDDFLYADVNDACIALTALVNRFHPGLRPEDVFAPAVAEQVLRRYKACVTTRQVISYTSETVDTSGPRTWRTTLFPIMDETGRVASIIGVCSPSTESEVDERLSLNDKASMAIGAIDGGYWIYEIASDTFEASRSLAELLAGPGHTTLGLADYISFIHSEDLAPSGIHDTELDRSEIEYRVITFDRRHLWLRSQRRTLRDRDGKPVRIVAHVTDITDQKRAFDTLRTEASTDALTSIMNRRAFDRRAAEAFAAGRADGKPVGVLLIDLDGFKPINDRYGHRIGDDVLRKMARRIGRFVRQSDCFARIGGDEFAILLRGSSAMMGEPLATRLREAFTRPFMVGQNKVFVGVSTGFAIQATNDQAIDDVIDRADKALYAMKQSRCRRSA